MIRGLADTRRATGGPCCICGADATQWHRSSRRGTDADGLTLAVRCCDAHERDALAAMHALTIADVAALVPRSRRAARAAGARSRADRLEGRGRRCLYASAALRGASSAHHTYAALGSMAGMEADCLRRLADALDAIATTRSTSP